MDNSPSKLVIPSFLLSIIFDVSLLDCAPSQLGLADGSIPQSNINVSSEDAFFTKAQLGAGLQF